MKRHNLVNRKVKRKAEYDTLPIEILIDIFERLTSFEDGKAASCVCQQWNLAYLAIRNIRESAVVNVRSVDELHELAELPARGRFINFRFHGIQIEEATMKFWSKFSSQIETLVIENCDWNLNEFFKFNERFSSLKKLTVIHEDSSYGCVLDHCLAGGLVNSVIAVDFTLPYWFTDKTFSRLMSFFPNVTQFFLDSRNVCRETVAIKRFYPHGYLTAIASNDVFTAAAINHYISHNKQPITHLGVRGRTCNEKNFIFHVQVPNLQLVHGDFSEFEFTSLCIDSLCEHQKSLVSICLKGCMQITDEDVVVMVKDLTNLKQIELTYCTKVTDVGFTALSLLQNLEVLDITRCHKIKGRYWEGVNRKLKELSMGHLPNLKAPSLVILLESVHKLTSLNLCKCRSVNNEIVKLIVNTNKSLTSLNLDGCRAITDEGLGYIAKGLSHTLLKLFISNIDVTERGYITYLKLPFLSVLDIGHNYTVTDKVLTALSKNTKALELLVLQGCPRVTNQGASKVLMTMKRLRTLQLEYTNVNEKLTEFLGYATCLKTLTVNHGAVSKKCLDNIKSLYPLLRLKQVEHACHVKFSPPAPPPPLPGNPT